MINAWSHPTDAQSAARRAGGRRHYNAVRTFQAAMRRKLVSKLLFQYGMLDYGVYARIARELGVSKSTITRDFQHLVASCRPCSCCGTSVSRGSVESPETIKDPLLPILVNLRDQGLSPREMATRLKEDGFKNHRGRWWTASQIKRMLAAEAASRKNDQKC